jgi:cytochrome P450
VPPLILFYKKAFTESFCSDTTASSLSCIFLYLALYPAVQRKLQEALDITFFSQGIEHTSQNLLSTDCQYLEAVMNETLRLHNPVQSSIQRMTPKEGIYIGERFIPGETLVFVSNQNIARGKLIVQMYSNLRLYEETISR